MPPRKAKAEEGPRTEPLSQKQEDLLIELFVQLSVQDRRDVIKLSRDLLKAQKKKS